MLLGAGHVLSHSVMFNRVSQIYILTTDFLLSCDPDLEAHVDFDDKSEKGSQGTFQFN